MRPDRATLAARVADTLAQRRRGKAVPDEDPALVEALARLEPALRRVVLTALEALRGSVDAAALADAIRAGRLTTPDLAAALQRLPAALRAPVADLLVAGAQAGAEAAAVGLTIDFTIVNPAAIAWAATRAAALVVEVTDATRAAIRDVVRDALEGRATAADAARLIQALVGLDPSRGRALTRWRAQWLADGIDGAALDDRTLRKARAYLRQRAETIARTELVTAATAGQDALWTEAARAGLIERTARRAWVATHDDRLEPVCFDLDGTTAPLNGEFPGGYARPPAHPRCRCTLRLVWPSA